MTPYTITHIEDNTFNITITDLFLEDLKQITEDLSLNKAKDISIMNNIDLFNNLLYRKSVMTFITELENTNIFKDNVTYTLNILHSDDRHILLIRNNMLDNENELYKGINGITYGTSIN
jgi:hypothetical protein